MLPDGMKPMRNLKGELPTRQAPLEAKPAGETRPEKTAPEQTEAQRIAAEEGPSHIQRLLKAKRKAGDRGRNDKAAGQRPV